MKSCGSSAGECRKPPHAFGIPFASEQLPLLSTSITAHPFERTRFGPFSPIGSLLLLVTLGVILVVFHSLQVSSLSCTSL